MSPRPGVLAGERNPSARLTAAAVMQIRAEYARGAASYRTLGRAYAVSKTQVGHIVKRTLWKHV